MAKIKYKDGSVKIFESYDEQMSRLNGIADKLFNTLAQDHPELTIAEFDCVGRLLADKKNVLLISGFRDS